jgi:hypothetical protein
MWRRQLSCIWARLHHCVGATCVDHVVGYHQLTGGGSSYITSVSGAGQLEFVYRALEEEATEVIEGGSFRDREVELFVKEFGLLDARLDLLAQAVANDEAVVIDDEYLAVLATDIPDLKVGARWVTLRARWVTLRARWVALRARWATLTTSLGDAHPLNDGDGESC